jgi:4-alpha-glucanotransferase
MDGGTRRAAEFRSYVAGQAWWLDEYALFRALHARHQERAWTHWPAPLRSRQPEALDAARAELNDEILFRQYLQWIAADQWSTARDRAGDVALFGDLPFMVSGDSADVWARQDEFRMDASVGSPGCLQRDGTGLGTAGVPVGGACRARSRLAARLARGATPISSTATAFDHLVGFYRTYFRPHDGGPPQFTPPDEERQLALGERVLGVLREPGSEIIAEDLGVIPGFVRASLTRLSVAGYKVFRWERGGPSKGSRSRIRSTILPFRWRRRGRTIPTRW